MVRSSVREFLASEAMYHLGIPTTRAARYMVIVSSVLIIISSKYGKVFLPCVGRTGEARKTCLYLTGFIRWWLVVACRQLIGLKPSSSHFPDW